MSAQEFKTVACEKCGEPKGADCVSKNGKSNPGLTHAIRKKLYYKTFMPDVYRRMYGDT